MTPKIIYQTSTQTFRIMPYNYWAASVNFNKLSFNSWDGMTKEMFKKYPLLKFKILVMYVKLLLTKKLQQ
jgi:hypothetical protein